MNQKSSILKALKWIVFNYIFLGILIVIGLVIAISPQLLGDVIPRHGTVGKWLAARNQMEGYRTKRVGTLIPIIER